MAKVKFWYHAKHGKKKFVGEYLWSHGERSFALVQVDSPRAKKHITFESHEAAKDAGWVHR